jgi:hypothetical protein
VIEKARQKVRDQSSSPSLPTDEKVSMPSN